MTRAAFDVRPDGQVIVTGSLAFDQIMVFPGNFKEYSQLQDESGLHEYDLD